MSRNAKVLSFSVSESVKLEVEKTAKLEGRTKSELFRDMFRAYVETKEKKEWAQLFAYGEAKAKELGVKTEEDIERIIEEARRA